MLCSSAVGGKFVFLGYGSMTEKNHTNGDCLTLGKQHAIHKLVHLGIPQQEFNDNGIDWSWICKKASFFRCRELFKGRMQWEDGRVKECMPTHLHAQTGRTEAPVCT